MTRVCDRVVLALVVAVWVAGCGFGPSLDSIEEDAVAALDRGDRAGAIARLDDAPLGRNAAEVLRLASLFLRVGEVTRARWRIEEGLSVFPDDDGLLIAMARAALLLSDPREAKAAAERVPESSEGHADALMLRAQAVLALGELEEALALYEDFVNRYPDRPDGVLAQIVTLEREHRLEDALAAADAASSIALDGDEALLKFLGWIDLRRASLLARLERRDDAVLLLREIVGLRPETVQAWSMLFDLEVRAGRGEAIAQEIVAAVEADPDRRSLYPMASAIHRRAGREAEAETLIATILSEATNVSPFLALATEHVRAGDFESAFSLYEEAILRHPNAPEPRMMRFDLLLALDRVALAEQDQVAVEAVLKDTDPVLDYLRARLELAAGDAAAARRRLEPLVSKLDWAPTQYWLGAALDELGDAEGARIRYGMAMQRDRQWILPKHALWRHALAAEDWQSVVGLARALAFAQPDDAQIWISLVSALIELEKPEAALAAATRAKERIPEEPSLVLAEARALRALGRVDDALAVLDEVEARHPEDAAGFAAQRALALAEADRVVEALVGLSAAREVDPDDPELLFVEASLFYSLGRAQDGDRATDRLLAVAPDRIDARYNRCRFRVAAGLYPEAREDCRIASEAMDTNAEVHFVRGVALNGSGATNEAEKSYAKAIGLGADDVRPRINLAELRLAAGDSDRALELAQAAYRLDPGHPSVLNLLARLYSTAGRHKRAALLMEKAARLSPERRDLAAFVEREQERASVSAAATQSGPSSRVSRGEIRQTRSAPTSALVARLATLDRPNIVLFVVDTLRADATTPYGHPKRPTPEIARWAERGVVFERVRAQSSWTKISMISVMTSLWPRSHGILDVHDGLGPAAVTLAEVLSVAGYETAAVQTNGWLHQSFGFHQGFDRYLFPQGARGRPVEKPRVWPHADRVVAEAFEIIERRDHERPLFLYLHFMDVHEYAAPPKFKQYGTSREGNYLAAARWVDHAIERVRRKLDDEGVLGETVLVFAADHGETFGEHGVYGHARNVLSPVVDVPLVIRLPFELEAPLRIPHQVRNLDLAPTLLDLASVEIPQSFEGQSLLTLLTGEEPGAARVSFARLGFPLFPDASAQSAIHEAGWTYARNDDADPDDPKAWRSRAVGPGLEMLFDHEVDPLENVDLIAMEPERASRLRAILESHLAVGEIGVRERGIRIDTGIAEKLRALGYLQ